MKPGLPTAALIVTLILVLVKMVENHFIAPTPSGGVFLIKRNRFIKNQYEMNICVQ